MNMHGIPQTGVGPGGVGVGMPGVSPGMMQQASPQQMVNIMGPQQQPPQQPPPQQQQTEKIDNISRIKVLIGPLRESLSMTMKTAAHSLHQNNVTDIGTMKSVDNAGAVPPRFDKHLEEFYSICDQIESHLKTSLQCIQQSNSANQYLHMNIANTRVEPVPQNENGPLSYPQYLTTVRTQIAYTDDIQNTLICAAQNIAK